MVGTDPSTYIYLTLQARRMMGDSLLRSWLWDNFDRDDENHYKNPAHYEEQRYETPGGSYIDNKQNRLFSSMLEELGAEKGDTVLELGAGVSRLSDSLNDRYDTIALDLEHEPLEYAGENGRADHFLQGSGLQLPLRDDAVDYIIAPRVMHLVDDPGLLDEMERVAEKGYGFDYFRKNSSRILYNRFMPMDSTLHTDDEIDGWLEGRNTTYRHSDFAIPFGGLRILTNETVADIAVSLDETLSQLDTGNTVGYIGVTLDDT